ncbi:MAG: hypothetical protein V3T23_03985 [Nitrososphaerales archaeon]
MPNVNDLHVDAVLTRYSQQYSNEEFIANSVLPWLQVNKRSNVWFEYDKDERFTPIDDTAAPRAKGNEVDFNVTTTNYSVKDKSLEDFVDQAEKDNADPPLDPRRDATDFLMELLMLKREQRVSGIIFDTASYPASQVTTPGTKWTDKTNSDPLADMLIAIDSVFTLPNIAVFGKSAWRVVRQHPKILDAIKGATRSQSAGGGVVSREQMATLLEVETVLVGRAKFNTAARGIAPAVFADLWGDSVAFLKVLSSPSPRTVTFGCSLTETMPMTRAWPDMSRGPKGGEMIKSLYNVDERLKASDLGALINDVI